jgi:hypothetical protein
VSQVHPEAYTALVTERSEALMVLRNRLQAEDKLTYDADLLINALQQAVDAAQEYKRRLAELSKTLRDHVHALDGATRQAEAMRHVIERGGTYSGAAARDSTDKLWLHDEPLMKPMPPSPAPADLEDETR